MHAHTMNILDFCNKHSIAWFPIALTFKNAGKMQNGETKIKKEIIPINHPAYNNKTPTCNDFKILTPAQLQARQLLASDKDARDMLGLNTIAIDTRRVFQIDYDTPNFPPEYSIFYDLSPWYASATKSYGKHVFITTDAVVEKDKLKMYGTEEGDIELLANGWAYASIDAEVQNPHDDILHQDAQTMQCYLPKAPEPKTVEVVGIPQEKSQSKYLELMKLIGNKIKRDEWLKLTGWAVNHITKSEYLDCIDEPYRQDGEKMWDDLALNRREISIYTIENIAKRTCPQKYKEWCETYKAMITLNILNKGEQDVCKYIAPTLKRTLIFCNGKWMAFNQNTKLWDMNVNPTALIIRAIQNEINARLAFLHSIIPNKSGEERTKMEGEVDDLNTHYRRATGGSYSAQCKRCLEHDLRDDDFYTKLNVCPYRIPFRNGMLNLQTGVLEQLEEEDYITCTLKRNYTPASEKTKAELKAELLKICNCNPEHLDYYLSILGYSFSGVASKEQLFWSIYGATAANGKSTVFEALRIICPELVSGLGSEFFEENEKQRHKTLNTLSGLTRIIFANELSKKKQDREFIKQIADGTTMSFNRMYGDKVELPIQFKAFIISNNILNFDNDNGIERRLRTCELTSSFRDVDADDLENRIFKVDRGFFSKLTGQWSDALLDIIFEYANQYFMEDKLKPYPTEWKAQNDEVIDMNNGFEDILNEFEFHPSYAITKDEMTAVFRERNMTYDRKVFMGEMKRYPKYKVTYDAKRKEKWNGKWISGVWVGMRKKQEEEIVIIEEELIEE